MIASASTLDFLEVRLDTAIDFIIGVLIDMNNYL